VGLLLRPVRIRHQRGVCLSVRVCVVTFVLSFFSGGKFISIGEKIRLPDDVTMGYIIGEYC
jgi:fringe protein